MRMHRSCLSFLAALFIGSALAAQSPEKAMAARIPHPDHSEFEASLGAPFIGDQGDARVFTLHFSFADAEDLAVAAWRVELTDSRGIILRTWRGEAAMASTQATVRVPWDGLDRRGMALPAGHYRVRLMASAMTQLEFRKAVQPDQASRVEHHLANASENVVDQAFDIQVGKPARPAMPAFRALPVSAAGEIVLAAAPKQGTPVESSRPAMNSLPYTIYFGNMHSQTNHSDGGGNVSTCAGSQAPQSGAYGPADAYQFALTQGLDVLMCSEHNHMYDGSTGTNLSADPVVARNLYQSGLSATSTFNAANPGFLGIYGMEWGVITNGGHLNILNADGLCGWELNSSGQLIGDYNTPKGDYAGLYTLMKTKGWVGQFNHPALSGQFVVGGTALGYSADGDEAMALCEVLNTSAFSTNLTETETANSSWEQTWNALLANGYHLAPSTDQDNHCANWGASYTNRTGVLIPTGTALTMLSFMDAVKARRVYATMDKNAQIILTANGHIMGERFANSGPLTLTVNYTSATGRTVAQVQIFEGVPGSGIAVSQTSNTAVTTITPANGEHFYYAKITQDNGDLMWSAPVWVTQGTGGDTQAPVVSASETGTSGTITFDATATDNVGVTKVEFYVDGVLKGTDTASPYTMTLDSTTLTNAAHSLTAKGYDAANNIGTSTAVSFTISNVGANTAPTISAIGNQTTAQDTATAPISFTVGDAETLAGSLSVTGSSSNAVLVPNANIIFGGSGSARTVTLTPAPGQSGTATITVTTTDGGGLTASTSFTLTVNPAVGSGSLIISQYYEGLSNDKWIEITNVGNATVNLASPQRYLALFANAAADAPSGVAPTSSLALAGSIAPGAPLLFKNSASVNPTYAAGTASGVINFNGDDLVILSSTNTTTAWADRLDVVGNGTTWGTDKSFVRIATVVNGNLTYTPAEWTQLTLAAVDGAAVGTTERLGTHVFGTPSPDTQAPTISATETGTSGTITFNATATDNVGVTSVEFYVDGVLKGTDTASPYTMTLDSTTLTNASHTLTAKAYDAAGNIGTSTGVAFTISNPVPDTQAPTVSATETGTSGTITFNATATDNVGVAKVEFYVDGVLKGTDTTSPYSMTLDSTTLTNASHTLTAKAYDAAGNIGTSTGVAFTISNTASTTYNEVEPNNTQSAANVVGTTITKIVGYFPSASDNDDYFNVTLLAGRTLTVDMVGPTASSQDYDLYLLSSTGTNLKSSTGSSTTERVSYKNTSTTASKVITIRVNRYVSYSSITPYTLTMSR